MQIGLPDVLDNFVEWNLGKGTGEKETNLVLNVEDVRCGNKNFPALFQDLLKFSDGIRRILCMLHPLQTDQVIKGIVCIGERLVQIANLHPQIRDGEKRGIDIATRHLKPHLPQSV